MDRTFEAQLIPLFNELKAYFKVPIVMSLQEADKPHNEYGDINYPFLTYNISNYNRVANTRYDTNQDRDVNELFNEQFELTVTFVAVSNNYYESIELAEKLHNWLRNMGKYFLSINKIVVVSETMVTNRDFFMVNDYERRMGFDAVIRLGREDNLVLPRIITAKVQFEESEE